MSRTTKALLFSCFAFLQPATAVPVIAQFAEVPVPEAMATLDFMVGEWTVEGRFRTPDYIGDDRTLWYLTRDGGVTRFDGQAWVAFAPGESAPADSIRKLASAEQASPYEFTHPLDVTRIQDGFALLLDEGRTSGTTLIYFDTEQDAWIATAFHAPTNAVTTSTAEKSDGMPMFEGRGTDRRGERIFRQRYELQGSDAFVIRTNVSFDEGVTWIDDQIVQEIHRR